MFIKSSTQKKKTETYGMIQVVRLKKNTNQKAQPKVANIYKINLNFMM